jgi:hypothetical protein
MVQDRGQDSVTIRCNAVEVDSARRNLAPRSLSLVETAVEVIQGSHRRVTPSMRKPSTHIDETSTRRSIQGPPVTPARNVAQYVIVRFGSQNNPIILHPLPTLLRIRLPPKNLLHIPSIRILLAREDLEPFESALTECVFGEHGGDCFADYLRREGEGLVW